MRLILNLLWATLGGGFFTALEYLLAGVVSCATVVGIPFGVQCFKLAGVALFPFGKDIDESSHGLATMPFNLVWFVLAGVWIFLTHLSLAIACAATIVGIPFAVQHLKLGLVALTPFGSRVRVVA